jgi:hypothetical protein
MESKIRWCEAKKYILGDLATKVATSSLRSGHPEIPYQLNYASDTGSL